MEKKKNKIELLAPAGNFINLQTAINAGADAVYFGVKEFNMRATAENFKLSDLKKIYEACKEKKIKKYLTLNTIIYDNEISKIEKVIKKSKKYIDAVICWDLSVISLCKKHKVPFHISTQASVSNKEAALFYKKLGAQRIVLARELSLNQIKEISKVIDVECFIHGAMCVAVSGRCFTSQFLFDKSANRGECKQICRREYLVKDREGNELKLKNNFVMSAKDLCSLPFIEKLKKAGIKSFKIEGRNKTPEYVDCVVRIYRNALDKKLTKKEVQNSIKELKKVYNKGFSSGFYLGLPTQDDFSKDEHSSSSEYKELIGKVMHYYNKQEVAEVKILYGKLKKGDEILVLGNKTGLIKMLIPKIEINHKEVKEAKKGQVVGIKIKDARKNNEVYLIKKRNLKN